MICDKCHWFLVSKTILQEVRQCTWHIVNRDKIPRVLRDDPKLYTDFKKCPTFKKQEAKDE